MLAVEILKQFLSRPESQTLTRKQNHSSKPIALQMKGCNKRRKVCTTFNSSLMYISNHLVNDSPDNKLSPDIPNLKKIKTSLRIDHAVLYLYINNILKVQIRVLGRQDRNNLNNIKRGILTISLA